MPSDSGVTSSNSISLVASEPPERMLACTAAPSATTSSGFSRYEASSEHLLDERAHPRDAG